MSYEFIQYQTNKQNAYVILDRPQFRIVQSRQLVEELDEAFKAAAADRGIKVIILAATGEHFSAGHDLGTADEQAVNHAQDCQGFKTHISAAHNLFMLSPTAEQDPGFALGKSTGKRRPMVQQALQNYNKHQKKQQEQQQNQQ